MILGGGFLGINAALQLSKTEYEVTLIDIDLTHEYLPGTIDLIRSRFEPQDLQIELENFLPDEVELIEAEVEDIREEEKIVDTKHQIISYDKLIVGLGGEPKTFGVDISEAENSWSIESAKRIARKSENAESAIVVGGGYVGVEIAGELAEKGLKTTVIDAKTRPMPRITTKSSEKILEIFQNKEIKFNGGKKITKVHKDGVTIEGGNKIQADMVIWCAGVQASKTTQKIFSCSEKGVEVNQGLSVTGKKNIFAGGDSINTKKEKTAHTAMHQGELIAKNIIHDPNPLKQMKDNKKLLLLSIGDKAALIYGDKIIYSSEYLRYFKDFVKEYYFTRLKIEKKLPNASFLP